MLSSPGLTTMWDGSVTQVSQRPNDRCEETFSFVGSQFQFNLSEPPELVDPTREGREVVDAIHQLMQNPVLYDPLRTRAPIITVPQCVPCNSRLE